MSAPHTGGHADRRSDSYADAILGVAQAEGVQIEVEQQLADFAEALNQSEELVDALADSEIGVERRLRIIEDLIGGQAHPVTVALLSMVVAVGRGGELADIADSVFERAAAGRNRRIARVRSAVPLNSRQKTRLAEAIKASTGIDVEIQATVEPALIGGVITEIGDDVVDGSIRTRLQQMRTSIT